MCVISSRDARVKNTSIMAVPLPDRRQLTVYSNEVGASTHGAMILPVPNNGGAIELVDLSRYPDMFKRLDATKHIKMKSLGVPRGLLQVHDVGSYRASIVPGVADLDRLDANEFHLTPEVLAFVLATYGHPAQHQSFSFVVCKLAQAETKYHPFGYRHDMLKSGDLFIPTMHYHTDQNGAQHTDWDHSIYLWNCELRQAPHGFQRFPCDPQDQYVTMLADELKLPTCHSLSVVNIDEYHANHDLTAYSASTSRFVAENPGIRLPE